MSLQDPVREETIEIVDASPLVTMWHDDLPEIEKIDVLMLHIDWELGNIREWTRKHRGRDPGAGIKGKALVKARRVNLKGLALLAAIRKGEEPLDKIEECKGYLAQADEILRGAGLETVDWKWWDALSFEEQTDELWGNIVHLMDNIKGGKRSIFPTQ